MLDFALIECWIKQSQADLKAARDANSEAEECHRRYWYQQSYEKAIKAYGLLKFRSDDPREEREFRQAYLRVHAPFTSLSGSGFGGRLQVFGRQLRTFLYSLDNSAILIKIDESIPTVDPARVSYRYPFLDDRTGTYIAPVDYHGWDAYQGNEEGVRSALDRLLRKVRDELIISRRSPS